MDLMDAFSAPAPPRNISNSEVTTFLSCKRQYEYAFMLDLQPIQTAVPLARGSIFHDAMHLYWRARMEGKDHAASMRAAEQAFVQPCEPTTLEVIMEAQFLWTRYMTFHDGFPDMEPLGTEVQLDLPLTSSLNMTIRYDLYFRERSTGKCYIIDYKLAYEFWTTDDHDLNGQMPKYIAVLQANGFQVDGGYLEEIRTRTLGAEKTRDPKNLWKRTRYVPSTPLKASVLRQHVAASLEIEKFRALPVEERKNVALPVLNKHGACKYCNFKDLCNSELQGKSDLTLDIKAGYTKNTYGYNKDEEVNF